MRVAEHGEAIWAKADAAPDRVEARCNSLMRQSIDQVEVDRGYAGAAQVFGRSRRLLETLHPVDGALNDGIEALHPKARAVDAAERQGVDDPTGQCARVDLDCHT